MELKCLICIKNTTKKNHRLPILQERRRVSSKWKSGFLLQGKEIERKGIFEEKKRKIRARRTAKTRVQPDHGYAKTRKGGGGLKRALLKKRHPLKERS